MRFILLGSGCVRPDLEHYAIQEGVAIEPMVEEVRAQFGCHGLIAGHDLLALDL